MAHVCPENAVIDTNSKEPVTSDGSGNVTPTGFPMPSCPYSFEPQQDTWPSPARAQVCSEPPAVDTYVCPPTTGRGVACRTRMFDEMKPAPN
jgi:hypothetical protein